MSETKDLSNSEDITIARMNALRAVGSSLRETRVGAAHDPVAVAIAVINSPPLRDIESLWRTTGDVYWGKESESGRSVPNCHI